ncbi:MAG: HU family DNA-binding protein [Alphaproteobacteria bacterium]|nr:HU family DNA-binding protein [Alphaproteobacteria bacterium]
MTKSNETNKPEAVNKNELITTVSELSGLTKTDSAKAIEGILQAITNSLKQDKEVRLVGFGTFKVTKRAAGEGRNPRTGEKIQIRASKLPKFQAGKNLKDAIA